MSYLNKDLEAKHIIERLVSAPVPTKAVWIRASLLNAQNKHPGKIKMIGHLLAPLMQNTLCRLFFLTNNDILIIGKEDIALLCLPQIDRIKQVLSDDTFIKEHANSFFTIYDIKTQYSLLLNALSGLKPDESTLDNPALLECAATALKKNNVTNFIHFSPVICLTLKQKKETYLNVRINWKALYEKLGLQGDFPGWMAQTIQRLFYEKILDQPTHFQEHGVPLILPFNPCLITTEQFDFFCQNHKEPFFAAFDAPAILSDEKSFYAALKKLHKLHIPWALNCPNSLVFNVLDFSKLNPDLILMPLDDQTLHMSIQSILFKKIILTQTQNKADLIKALRQGFILFQGSLMSMIKADACQKTCPYGDACPTGLCAQIIQNKAPSNACVFSSYRTHFIFNETDLA